MIHVSMDTKELLHHLSKAHNIGTFLSEFENEFHQLSCKEFINGIIQQKQLSIASIARKSGHGDYVYKVINGERTPSRDVLISIAIGMGLSFEETQLLLRIAKAATLDPRDRRDSVIIYGIQKQFNIDKLNDLLYEMQQQTL